MLKLLLVVHVLGVTATLLKIPLGSLAIGARAHGSRHGLRLVGDFGRRNLVARLQCGNFLLLVGEEHLVAQFELRDQCIVGRRQAGPLTYLVQAFAVELEFVHELAVALLMARLALLQESAHLVDGLIMGR